ncbi:MAG: 50S ribosomal protein L25 [Spirochaetaceae bacterium]|jgi:large subunit ribosomal protein L25|nr:50S ribosomal protein L25 [Spirochaetaceae bacterium]
MSDVIFQAKQRTDCGKGAARRLRKTGRLPGVIYGREGAAATIDLDTREFIAGVKGISESTIVQVEIDGVKHDAFVKATQRTIQDGNILHVDFYEIERGKVLRAKVRVHVNGNPIGVREGGILEIPIHDVEVECLPKDLPRRINVDISTLAVNQSIHVRDLALGDGVKLISAEDQVVALVKFAKAEKAAEEEGGETADEAASSSAPAKE